MRLSREGLLRQSGAGAEELDALEARGLIVPSYIYIPFWRSGPWYARTDADVLRRYVAGRRAIEASRRE
jgi:hypothetical protein